MENASSEVASEKKIKSIKVAIIGTTNYMRHKHFRSLFTNRAINSVTELHNDYFYIEAKPRRILCVEYHSSAVVNLFNPNNFDLLFFIVDLATNAELGSIDWTMNALKKNASQRMPGYNRLWSDHYTEICRIVGTLLETETCG